MHSSRDDQIASNYFEFANDFVGIMAFSLGIAALQFQHGSRLIAMLSLIVLFSWLVSKGGEYKNVADRLFPKGTPIAKYLYFGWRIKIYLGGMLFLLSVASGWIDMAVVRRLEALLP